MSYFRMLYDRRHWDRLNIEELEWLVVGDIPADPITNLRSADNKLSVFKLENRDSNFPRIAAALASNRQQIAKLDYIIFPIDSLSMLKINIEECLGETPHNEVNHWHLNLTNLTADNVIRLVAYLMENGEIGRLQPNEVSTYLKSCISNNEIDLNRLNKSIKKELGIS